MLRRVTSLPPPAAAHGHDLIDGPGRPEAAAFGRGLTIASILEAREGTAMARYFAFFFVGSAFAAGVVCMVEILIAGLFGAMLVVGFMLGHVTRAAISHHRRQQAQRR